MVRVVDLHNIRNITISGRIGSGATTLAQKLSHALGWNMLDGGKIMRKIHEEIGAAVFATEARPDQFDLDYEEKVKNILKEEAYQIIQSHLAGFDAQGIEGVFKILVVCEDKEGDDRIDMRIDRLVNRDGISVDEAKHEALERDKQNLSKWRRLYAEGDQNWAYWDKKYYDLVVNTYSHNKDQALSFVLEAMGHKT